MENQINFKQLKHEFFGRFCTSQIINEYNTFSVTLFFDGKKIFYQENKLEINSNKIYNTISNIAREVGLTLDME